MFRENARVDAIARTRHGLESVRVSANSAAERKLFAGGRMLDVQGALIALHAHSLDEIMTCKKSSDTPGYVGDN